MNGVSSKKKESIPYSVVNPPNAEYFLKRPSIDRLLQNAFRKPLTTVIAGAGYGKTQAVLSALNSIDCNKAWIELSSLDNLVTRFWERLIGVFKPWSKQLYENLVLLGYPESIAAFDRFLRLLTNAFTPNIESQDISTPSSHFILVLDDFHLINNKSILGFIEMFIMARVDDFSIVLISRKKPDISISGMLSKGLLTRITENELRFSSEEITEYFEQYGITISGSTIDDIYVYTNGWIFAIYLVALASIKGGNKDYNPILEVKLDIHDLIEKEIYQTASLALQHLLIKTTYFDTIPSDFLKVLANNSSSLVTEMQQLSMFIRFDSYDNSYHVHQLFKEFLQEKRQTLDEKEVYDIHLSAAKWFKENNYNFEAIHHYIQIKDYPEVFKIIISIPGRIPSQPANAIVNLIDQAPIDAIESMPIIRVVKAGYLFNNNRLDEAKQELTDLRVAYEGRNQTEETDSVLGEVYLLLAVINMVTSDYSFEELFMLADKLLLGGSRLVDYRTGIAEGVNACSIKIPVSGELQRYQDTLFRTAPYMARVMNGCGYGMEYLNAAESCLYTGNLKEAEKNAYEAIFRSRQYMQHDIEYMANFVLVRIYTARGNYEKVTSLLQQMEEQLDIHQNIDCIHLYDMISGWFYTKLGKTHRVARWIRYQEKANETVAPVVIGREYLVRSDSLLSEERYYELLAFMEETDSIYESRGILFATIQNTITKAIVHHYMGNKDEAMHFLETAYELSYPNDLVMQYIEYGNRMRTLIHSIRQDKSCKIPKIWLDRIYTKSSSYAKMLSQLVSKYDTLYLLEDENRFSFSKRETELLSYLFKGMTRKEMASSSYLSLSTINSNLRSIYNKLGASNAVEAVRIAKENSLI